MAGVESVGKGVGIREEPRIVRSYGFEPLVLSSGYMQKPQELFNLYKDECQFIRRLRPATIRSSEEAFKHFIRIMPEIERLEELSPSLITIFFKRLQTRERIVGSTKKIGINDSTIASYVSRLKTFFTWLAKRDYISANPFDGLNFARPVYSDHRALTGDEIKRIMGAIAQYSRNPFLLKRDIAIVGVLTFCGLRRNELVSLEIHDLDLHQGFLTVRAETSKSKKVRKIPINLHLKMHLKEYLQIRKTRGCKTPFLFVSNCGDRPFTSHGIKHWVAKLARTSGVKFHIHRFRHTFATNLAMQDVGSFKIQKLMGHKDLKMTQTYLRSIATEEMEEDINKLSFENLV